jgi:hypothetical protein
MNPLLITVGLRALKFLINAPRLRSRFAATLTAEQSDVSPEVVAALSGDAAAIALLAAQIDEAAAENRAIVARLERRVTQGDSWRD